MDERVVPMRGQLVVVANESGGMFGLSGADDMHNGLGECCYVIPRPAGIHLLSHNVINSFASATYTKRSVRGRYCYWRFVTSHLVEGA
jgi:hypothetical protein